MGECKHEKLMAGLLKMRDPKCGEVIKSFVKEICWNGLIFDPDAEPKSILYYCNGEKKSESE